MQTTSPLLQLLQLMENLYVVAAMVVVVIIIRLLYARHLGKKAPASTMGTVTAKKRRDKELKEESNAAPERPKKNLTLEILDTVLIALILVFGIVRPLFLQTFFIPSESMVPLLHVKDKLIANKFIYHFRVPQRGEVIVFKPPTEAVVGSNAQLLQRFWLETSPLEDIRALDPELADNRARELSRLPAFPTRYDDYIKRVVAVPGDRIRIVEGTGVYINGTLLREPYLTAAAVASLENFPVRPESPLPPPPFHDPRVQQDIGEIRARLEAQTGRRYTEHDAYFAMLAVGWLQNWYAATHTYPLRMQPYVNAGEFVVPPDAVFVMGDNRPNSFDSRFWGVVPLRDVKARAVSTFWPLIYEGNFNIKLL